MRQFDILVNDIRVIDGTGGQSFISDVGIKNGKIEFIGNAMDSDADTIINGEGLALSPGFIDMHGHSDLHMFFKSSLSNKLEQGITTEFSGLCGMTLAPVSVKHFNSLKSYLGLDQLCDGSADFNNKWASYESFGGFVNGAEQLKIGVNIGFYVGHGTVRIAVMGFEAREASNKELDNMKFLVEDAMSNGAVGLSTGLIYAPGVYTQKPEIIELCKIVKKHGGIYATHIRSESDGVINAVKEAIDVGRQSGVPVLISHHKIAGKENWGKSVNTLRLIDEAINEGIEVFLDQYPYKTGQAPLAITIPPEYHEGGCGKLIERINDKTIRNEIKKEISKKTGSWENMIMSCGFDGIIMQSDILREINGKTIAQYAEENSIDPYEALFDVLIKTNCSASASFFLMCDEDIERIMKYPYTMIGTDSGVFPEHPRATGTFAKVIGWYSREKGLMSLEETIRKMTSLPASVMNLRTKGLVREGLDADIVIFNPYTIIDKADYNNPEAGNIGIEYVIVNGKVAVANNKYTGIDCGKILR
jgi:N-acyl-D-amino-acid deacylase